jgi:hypothetical protein
MKRNEFKANVKVKTLEEQMLEYDERKEKMEQLTKELIVNPEWNIIEEEGEFYAVDFWGGEHLINVKMREEFPNSYFHSPECDKGIIGYDPFSGSIIYNLWKVGKAEMAASEDISSDFHDTGYGIGKLLSRFEEHGFGGKVPPTHILPTDFIDYHFDLQGSIYHWGYDISLVNSIGMEEHHRIDLKNEIQFKKEHLEKYGNKWSEDDRNTAQKRLEDLKKEYDALDKSSKSR